MNIEEEAESVVRMKRYKELSRQYYELQRQGRDEETDPICDEMDPLWYKLTPEEQTEIREYGIYLHSLWSPQEHYVEACRVVENIKSLIPAGPNDVTPLESRLKCLAYWEAKRDKAKEKLDEQLMEKYSKLAK